MAANKISRNQSIMPQEAERTVGRDAQRNNILAGKLVAETVRTTLGPKGMDKMLVDNLGDIIVTNDGATILREMQIEHPAAKMIVEIAKTQLGTEPHQPSSLQANCSRTLKLCLTQTFILLSSSRAIALQRKKHLKWCAPLHNPSLLQTLKSCIRSCPLLSPAKVLKTRKRTSPNFWLKQ